MSHTIGSARPSIADSEGRAAAEEERGAALVGAYQEHAPAIFSFAHRLTGDRSLAEEVCQEVFVRLWQRPERFDASRGSLRSFLLAECHSRAVDAVRSETARRRREERDARSVERTAPADVADDVCTRSLHQQLAQLVQTLPGRQRELISLAFGDEITYREVATVLDLPEGTVKGRIRSGLARLRGELTALGITAR